LPTQWSLTSDLAQREARRISNIASKGIGLKVGHVTRKEFAARTEQLVAGQAILERFAAAIPSASATSLGEFKKLRGRADAVCSSYLRCREYVRPLRARGRAFYSESRASLPRSDCHFYRLLLAFSVSFFDSFLDTSPNPYGRAGELPKRRRRQVKRLISAPTRPRRLAAAEVAMIAVEAAV
jgi:hypothetical protein